MSDYVQRLEERVAELEALSEHYKNSYEALWWDAGELYKVIQYIANSPGNIERESIGFAIRDELHITSPEGVRNEREILAASGVYKWFTEHALEGTPDDPNAPRKPC